MLNSKLIRILKKLSKSEIKLLEKFVSSPIHNKHQDVITLLKYLRKHLYTKPERINNKQVFRALFPKQDFVAQKLHYVNSYLLKVVEEFLAWQEWKEDEVSQQIYLVKSFNKHGLGQPLQKAYDQAIQLQETLPQRNANYFWQKYQLNFGQIEYYRTLGRSVDFNLQQLSELLDTSFIAEKLKSSCAMISHQAITKKSYDMGLLDKIFDFIQQENLLEEPAIATYYYAYQALSDTENTDNFYQLLAQLNKHENKFSTSELRDIYLLSINFCIKRWNRGDKTIMKDILGLYQSGLKVDVFLENGVLSRWSYNNIVIAGLLRKEYNWVKNFIEEYASLLPEEHKESSYNFNLAKFHYETNNFAEAMVLLREVDYDDLFHTMGGKIILAKIFYEQSEVDALENLIKSVQLFIHRKKVLGYHKEVYLSIFGYIKKLSHLNPYDKQAVETLKKEIVETQNLPEKDWLIEKLQKLS